MEIFLKPTMSQTEGFWINTDDYSFNTEYGEEGSGTCPELEQFFRDWEAENGLLNKHFFKFGDIENVNEPDELFRLLISAYSGPATYTPFSLTRLIAILVWADEDASRDDIIKAVVNLECSDDFDDVTDTDNRTVYTDPIEAIEASQSIEIPSEVVGYLDVTGVVDDDGNIKVVTFDDTTYYLT